MVICLNTINNLVGTTDLLIFYGIFLIDTLHF